jgi:hypothetical protein
MSIKAKIRLDFKAESGGGKFFWKRHNLQEIAKTLRSRHVTLLRNLPFQGLNVEELNEDREVYLIPDVANHRGIAYAPLELTVEADSIEDLMQFTLKEEFRKIKIIEPNEVYLSNGEVERLLVKVNQEYREEIFDQD